MIALALVLLFLVVWTILGTVVYLHHLEQKVWKEESPIWILLLAAPLLVITWFTMVISILCAKRDRNGK